MTVTQKGYPTVTHTTPKIWPSVMAAILLLIARAAPAAAQAYTIMPTPFQAPLNDSGALVVGGCVWTYAAGTTTPISTYTNTSGTPNSNPIVVDSTGRFTAYLLAGTNYKFVYETACTPPAHGAVLRTADNIAGTPAAAATVDITCTAGEAISAGQAVYLSAGSGGKTAGQCYRADTANGYSSTAATVVGLAPAAIASAVAGTVRIAGSVTGLSSLAAGSDYYIGSAGAITATVPTNARKLAQADTATSVVLPLPLQNTDNGINDFRLTLETGVPVSSTDQTAKTTLFWTPTGKGNRIALPDSAGVATIYTSAQISIAVPATTSQLYSVFVFASSGAPALELAAWTNDTTPGTAAFSVNATTGTYTKTSDITRLYVGLMRTSTVSGQTTDAASSRLVINHYNRVARPLLLKSATASWTYATGAWHQANASTTNQVEFVIGVNDAPVRARLVGAATQGTAAAWGVGIAFGLDSTTVASGLWQMSAAWDNGGTIGPAPLVATYDELPGTGRHLLQWLEYGNAGGNTTFFGTGTPSSSGPVQAGISGWIEG